MSEPNIFLRHTRRIYTVDVKYKSVQTQQGKVVKIKKNAEKRWIFGLLRKVFTRDMNSYEAEAFDKDVLVLQILLSDTYESFLNNYINALL